MSQILQELFSGVLFLFTAEGLKTLAMFIIAFALIYLAIKMGRDYPQLAASGEWTGERIAALCGTIGFAVIGAALLAVVAVRFVREWKEEARRELERQTEEAEKTEEATDE